MRILSGIALAVAVTAVSARAEGPAAEDRAALEACIDASGAADLSMKDCYVELANKEDARLNRNWQRLMQAVDGSGTEIGTALLTEQRAWIDYKEAACDHYLVLGGTLDRLQGQVCYTELITRRADELEQLANFYADTL